MPLDFVLRAKPPYRIYLKDGDGDLHLVDTILPVQDDWVVLLRKSAQQVKVFQPSESEGE